MTYLYVALALGILGVAVVVAGIRARNMHYWLGTYLRRPARPSQPKTIVYVAVADHYEPYEGTKDREAAYRRLNRWELGHRRRSEPLTTPTLATR
jgi:hypothetical protein